MQALFTAVWGFLNYKINFSIVLGHNIQVSLWNVFTASTIIYLLVCFAKYFTGSSEDQ